MLFLISSTTPRGGFPLEMRERSLEPIKNLPQLRLKPVLAYLHRPHVYLHTMYSALETGPLGLTTLSDEDNNHHKRWVECPESHMKNELNGKRQPQGCWVKRAEEETFKPRHSQAQRWGQEEEKSILERRNSTKTQYLGFCELGKLEAKFSHGGDHVTEGAR